MTRTWTRARCTTPEHALRARSLRHTLMLGHMHLVAQVLSPVMSSMYTCVSLFEFTSLTLYFDLSFTILSLFFLLMHFEQHIELDNLITMQNLRTFANKGSNDAYDVHTSLTNYGCSCSEQTQSSRPASRGLENSFHKLIARISTRPKNQPSPLPWSTTSHPMENQNR